MYAIRPSHLVHILYISGIDWASRSRRDPLAALSLAALVVAAFAVLASPLTAWLTYRWTRDSERERRDHELKLEAARWERDDKARRLKRGEDAANELATIVDRAQLTLREMGKYEQKMFAPFYYDIRRLSLLLTDDATRDRMLEVASAVNYFRQAEEVEPVLSRWSIANAYASASHEVLRAYLLGRPCPDTPRMARLTALINEGGDLMVKEIGEDEPDPLDEPPTSDAESPADDEQQGLFE